MDTLSIPHQRLRGMLRTAMGDVLTAALADPNVFKIFFNPDGTVRFDKAGEGRVAGSLSMPPADAERIVRLVASHVRIGIDSERQIVSAELPMASDGTGGERFEGILPPAARAPCFSIRKPAYRLFALEDYVAIDAMTIAQARALRRTVRHRENILVVGGNSSGKTTLTNAMLAEVAELQERVKASISGVSRPVERSKYFEAETRLRTLEGREFDVLVTDAFPKSIDVQPRFTVGWSNSVPRSCAWISVLRRSPVSITPSIWPHGSVF